MKVCKFGGTSMANAESILRVMDIIKSDGERKYIVVSAPGKRNAKDRKITDMLYECCDDALKNGKCGDTFSKIEERFLQIQNDLQIDCDMQTLLENIRGKIEKQLSRAYSASRGEYLSAILLSKKLGVPFVDAQDIVRFDGDGELDADLSVKLITERLADVPCAVIPGFYGSNAKGEIITFSRGGSDITGALVARATGADIYENWTDVNGFLVADPRIVDNPQYIEYLSYKELRELSYMGAEVMHPESILPVSRAGIPINIKNTFNPTHPGTMIVRREDLPENTRTVTGIAGKKGLTIINIEKEMMNSEIGFGARVLSVLADEKISFEHIPSGIDTLSVVVCDECVKGKMQLLLHKIQDAVNADSIELHGGLSLIAVVGHKMSAKAGTAGRVFGALSNNGINVRMIDQGSSELNIILGVSTNDYERAINAVYNEFFDTNKGENAIING